MKTSTRAFVEAIRQGKSIEDAMREYCWANLKVPIRKEDLLKYGDDPKKTDNALWGMWRYYAAAETALELGADDEQLAKAFEEGLKAERECDYYPIVWRVMRDDERPSAGDLLRAMPEADRLKAVELFGVKYVARQMYGSR